MRTTTLLLACGSAAFLASCSTPTGPHKVESKNANEQLPAKPPHIVFFLADDLGWRDVGFHGGEIKTPSIDKLAASGTQLDQFYVQPVCSPTRAAFMTGRYPIRTGLQVGVIRPWAKYGLPLDERILPQILGDAGYATAICGKWHLGTATPAHLPTRRGFDHQYGHYLGMIDYYKHSRMEGKDWNRNDKPLDEKGYTTNLIARECVRIINAHDKSRPLFLYVPFNAPHSPFQAPKKFIDMYQSIGKPNRRKYAAMVTCMDAAIGRILAALDRRSMRDDTLVLFTSDNGGARQSDNGHLRGRKGSVYEGGTRSPTVVSWPGRVKAGAIVDQPLHIVDLLPTLTAIAGAETTGCKPLDGKNAWATITKGAPSPHEDILYNVNNQVGAIRAGDWKLVHRRGANNNRRRANRNYRNNNRRNRAAPAGFQLFNLAQDPNEKIDVKDQQPAKLAELKARLAAYRKAAEKAKGSPARPPATFKAPRRWGHADQRR